jgi:CheY-like chemotaxis protein/HPt (histidine-containing phosphotransfer) domain-containing protein
MLTSISMLSAARRFIDKEFAGYVVKPVQSARLFEVLASAWGGFRLAAGKGDGAPRHETAAVSSNPGSRQLIRARVLLVEDQEVNQRVACLRLEQMGCRVDVAANGLEAVKMVAMLPYDVVFMDCQMPELDGYEATKRIRESETSAARLPIVAMTAHAMQGDRQRCLDSGMDDYISKPVVPDALYAALMRWAPSRLDGALDAATTDESAVDPPDASLAASVRKLADEFGAEGIGEILELFRGEMDGSIASLGASVRDGDIDGVRHAAHSLKGNCLTLGALPLSELAREIEILAADGSLTAVVPLVVRLEEEAARVGAALVAVSLVDATARVAD